MKEVLNLVINGIPSILTTVQEKPLVGALVLNLVINGIPSILKIGLQYPITEENMF